MELLDSLKVYHKSKERNIELYRGDLTDMLPEEAVDVLIVSAFPGDYTPVRDTLIGALWNRRVSVADLANSKAEDLRENFSCWLSQEISPRPPGIQFKRILCYEPKSRRKAAESVGDIFQCLIPLTEGPEPITSVAMPLVSTGNVRAPLADMIESLFEAAVHWFRLGLSVKSIKIVQLSELKAAEIKGAFSILKKRFSPSQGKSHYYDLFISYSHQNAEDADFIIEELRRLRPGVRIFLDRQNLNPGRAWQSEIFEALDACNKVVAIYSPYYVTSKMCKEEFSIALLRNREADGKVLIPIYLSGPSDILPTYMRVVQFIDCRESDRDKLKGACERIVSELDD